MKPGDLVRLNTFFDEPASIVEVPKSSSSGQFFCENGSIAMFLGEYFPIPSIVAEPKSLILIDGRIGWVYDNELEMIDEAR